MKKFLLLALIGMFFSTASFAQDDQGIQDDLNEYIQLTKDMKFDALMEYINPELFEFVPRDLLVQTFEEIFNTPGMDFSFGDFTVEKVHPSISADGKTYALVDYAMDMTMKFTGEDAEEMDDEALDLMESMFAMQFGEDNVERLEGKAFKINTEKTQNTKQIQQQIYRQKSKI